MVTTRIIDDIENRLTRRLIELGKSIAQLTLIKLINPETNKYGFYYKDNISRQDLVAFGHSLDAELGKLRELLEESLSARAEYVAVNGALWLPGMDSNRDTRSKPNSSWDQVEYSVDPESELAENFGRDFSFVIENLEDWCSDILSGDGDQVLRAREIFQAMAEFLGFNKLVQRVRSEK